MSRIHRSGAGDTGRERGWGVGDRWRSLDRHFLIAHCGRVDPVNLWRVVQDMELRLHYGGSFTPEDQLAGLLQDTTLS